MMSERARVVLFDAASKTPVTPRDTRDRRAPVTDALVVRIGLPAFAAAALQPRLAMSLAAMRQA